MNFIERLFRLKDNNTSIYAEFDAGIATFMTMSYIIFVNPMLLSTTGMDPESIMVATCVSSAFASLLLGIYANYPIALAPGMGINAYFAFIAVPFVQKRLVELNIEHLHNPWHIGLTAVLVSGMIFLIFTLFNIREMLMYSIPSSLKYGIASGIGILIAFLGFIDAGFIRADEATFVTIGDITAFVPVVSMLGLFLIAVLHSKKIKGAIIIGIVFVAILGLLFDESATLPERIISFPSVAPTFFKFDFSGLLKVGVLDIIFVFLFMDLLDTLGSIIGIGEQGGFIKDNKFPRVNRIMRTDALGTVAGAMLGTSTVTAYIESAAGVAEGGRTGLTSVFVALFFLMAVFFSPLVAVIPNYATAPALIVVGSFMISVLRKVDWDDITEYTPSFLVMVGIPLTFSIANGIALGFISFCFIKLFTGRFREIKPLTAILAILLILKYIYI